MRFCPNCGNPLGGSPRYCAGCATQVGPENEPVSGSAVQVGAGSPPPGRTSVPAWSPDAPAPWLPDAPAPWLPDASAPWLPDGPPPADPWQASPPPWTASNPPWPASARPAAGDQPEAVTTGHAGATGQAARPGDRGAARPGRRPRLSRDRWNRVSLDRWPWLSRARRSQLSAGHGMTITVMVTTVALLVTAGIAAWQVGQMRSQVPVRNTSLATRGAGPSRTPGPRHTPARAALPSPATPLTGSPALHGAVTVTPAAAGQPHVHRVVTLLHRYFSAINRHDFQAYSGLFIPAIRVGMHNFGAAYQSTRDARARLTGLSATGPQGLAAMVTFVSHQNPASSPDHAACDRWHIALFLKRAGPGYLIRRHQPGFPADTVRACR